MTFTYFGHSCFMLTLNDGKRLLFDPYITPNNKASHIDIYKITCEYILISHAHGDHIADAVSIAKNTGAKMIGVYEVINWFEARGITNNHHMNTGGSYSFDFGSIKLTNAIHSSQFPDGTMGGNPVGFLITTHDGKTIYYAGDTALTMDMKIIGDYYTPSIAILPIGDNFTMGYHDASIASDFLNCNNVIGVHFDTFPWIKIDHVTVQQHFADAGKKILLPDIGEVIEI